MQLKELIINSVMSVLIEAYSSVDKVKIEIPPVYKGHENMFLYNNYGLWDVKYITIKDKDILEVGIENEVH